MSANLVPAIDGMQTLGVITEVGCCPPSLCNIDYCSFICSFMDYLPKGPLWDYWKRLRFQQVQNAGTNALDCSFTSCDDDNACLTIIDHTIYIAKKLLYVLQNPLQTVVWESDPLTAFITRQYYLDTAGWKDCFEGPGRSVKLGQITPYEAVCNPLLPQVVCDLETTLYQMSPTINGNQNPIINIEELVKAACPSALNLAVQYGILVALQRLNLGVIRNVDGINFVLAPLGCQISVIVTDPLIGDCAVDCNQMSGSFDTCVLVDDLNQMTGNRACIPYRPCMQVTISNITPYIPAGPGITEPLTCENARDDKTKILAYYYFPGIEMPVTTECPATTIAGAADIWPAMMAAECILISMLPFNMRYSLKRAFNS